MNNMKNVLRICNLNIGINLNCLNIPRSELLLHRDIGFKPKLLHETIILFKTNNVIHIRNIKLVSAHHILSLKYFLFWSHEKSFDHILVIIVSWTLTKSGRAGLYIPHMYKNTVLNHMERLSTYLGLGWKPYRGFF